LKAVKQAICWPESCDHIVVSGLEVFCVFFFSKLLAWYWLSVGKRDRVHAKAEFWSKLTPGALLTFLQTYSLNNIGSPWYIVLLICTTLDKLGTLIRYSYLKFNWEKLRNHTLNIYMLKINWSFFQFLIQERQILFFSLWLVIAIRSSAFRLG